MANVADITASLKTLTATFLGASFSELAHATIVEKNTFKGGKKRYGVLPKEIDQVVGVTCYLTVDQAFEVILTDSYGGKALADADKQTKTIDLQDLMFDLYADIVKAKAGSPGIVIHIDDLSIAAPEYLEDDHIVKITASMNIKYRTQL